MYVREGGAEPLPTREETAYGPRVLRSPVPLHPAGWPELGQRAQQLAALPPRILQLRSCKARACSSRSAAPQAGRAEESEEGWGSCCERAGVRAHPGRARHVRALIRSEKDACAILQERFRHVGRYTAEFYLHCVGRSVYDS